jgi:flagellar FliJ protein
VASPGALRTLLELARRRNDDAERDLGTALQFASATKRKLELLLQYRDEYASRFESGLFRGLSALEYSNFRSFLGKLETAAGDQQELLRDAEAQVEARRAAWKAAARRQESFAALASRMESEQRKRADRRDQRLTDESAVRSKLSRKRV